jgi:DnaJ family protein A protein 2
MGNMGNDGEQFDISSFLKPPTSVVVSENLHKTRDICFELNVDLEDFYTGKKKKLNIKRKRIVEVDGVQKVVEEKKKIIIPIEKGMKDEHQIRFEGEADQIPGYLPGDIIITLVENEHSLFQRDNDNLIIIKNINLYQNYDIQFDIKHLDGRTIRIVNHDPEALHLNDGLRKISHEGMPVYKSDDFGDLFIRFNLVIPKTISPEKLKQIDGVFDHPEFDNPLGETYTKICMLENVTDEDFEETDNSEDDYSDESSELSESSDDISSVSSDSSERPVPKKLLPKRR